MRPRHHSLTKTTNVHPILSRIPPRMQREVSAKVSLSKTGRMIRNDLVFLKLRSAWITMQGNDAQLSSLILCSNLHRFMIVGRFPLGVIF